ncbi:serine/threonine protein kinase [Methylocaldum sp. MU1018]
MNILPDTHPFSSLTPDCVMNALDSAGFHGDGSLLALHSYENRVYRIGIEDGPPVVAKFYRPERWSHAAILEEHDFMRELAESELPVVPALPGSGGSTLHRFGGFLFAVFPTQGGHAPEFDDYATLERMGRLIGRIHAVGALKPYHARPALDIASFGEEPRDYLLSHSLIPSDIADAYRDAVNRALDGVKRCFERAGPVRALRLHGDCYPGNMLWADDGPHFVDFDDSRMGPAVQDLWMLLSGDRQEMARQLSHLLAGYESFFDFDTRELHLIEALRTLRLIHYAAWIARRWDDPAFPIAFPWFNTPRYWHDRVLELREQIALMDEPPLRAA